MKRFLHLLLVLFISVALPLQSVAAVAMPFCTNTEADPHAGHHGSAAMADDHTGHGAPASQHALLSPCDDCGLCHLAGAGAIALATSCLADSLRSVQQPASASVAISFFPDLFLRPPRPALL